MATPTSVKRLAVFLLMAPPLALQTMTTQDLMATAAVKPQPAVINFSMAGTGCRGGGGKATFAPDGNLRLEIPAIVADKGAGRPLLRASCNAIVEVKHAGGWQVALDAIEMEATTKLPKGTESLLYFTSHFQGAEGTIKQKAAAKDGPQTLQLAGDYGKCGESSTLIIGFGAILKGKDAARIDLKRAGPLRLKWRKCKG